MTFRHKRHSHVEHELERKRKELYTLERRLAKLENELEDLREEISEFELFYAEHMSERITELESLEKELKKLYSSDAGNDAGHAYERARSFENDANQPIKNVNRGSFVGRQDETLKEVYRRVAKAIHPDLAPAEGERKRRQKLMADANQAYAEEDYATLLSILEEWELDKDSDFRVETEQSVMDRRISRVSDRIRAVESEMVLLKNSDTYRLVQQVKDAKWRGRNVLSEMTAKLEADILSACRKLNVAKLRRQGEVFDAPSGVRIVHFLPDRSIGTLFVRHSSSRNFLDWRRLGEALGSVTVPVGKALRLDLAQGRACDLDLLPALGVNDLQACYLYGADNGAISYMLRFRGVEEIYLSGEGITGEGLIHLLELKNLERLYLYDTAINDSGLLCLKYLVGLKYLTLCNAPITEAGLNRLKTSLQSCAIINLTVPRK